MIPIQIASGILIAAFVILIIKLGMNIHRNNDGYAGVFGGVLFIVGTMTAMSLIVSGSNP